MLPFDSFPKLVSNIVVFTEFFSDFCLIVFSKNGKINTPILQICENFPLKSRTSDDPATPRPTHPFPGKHPPPSPTPAGMFWPGRGLELFLIKFPIISFTEEEEK
jgi:hypothetical protein